MTCVSNKSLYSELPPDALPLVRIYNDRSTSIRINPPWPYLVKSDSGKYISFIDTVIAWLRSKDLT